MIKKPQSFSSVSCQPISRHGAVMILSLRDSEVSTAILSRMKARKLAREIQAAIRLRRPKPSTKRGGR